VTGPMTAPTHVGLLDTSVVISLGQLNEADLPAYPVVSAITLAELSAGPLVTSNDQERQRRQLVLQMTESSFDPLPFDDACARRFGEVAAGLRASGRTTRARAFDALIAAAALAHELPVFTGNPADVTDIPGLEIHEVTIPR
jgi:tRNA(fMet)-specific endonuclease VapC